MNTYSSQKSLTSKVQGRKIEEPDIKIQQQPISPRHHSPQQTIKINKVNKQEISQPKVLSQTIKNNKKSNSGIKQKPNKINESQMSSPQTIKKQQKQSLQSQLLSKEKKQQQQQQKIKVEQNKIKKQSLLKVQNKIKQKQELEKNNIQNKQKSNQELQQFMSEKRVKDSVATKKSELQTLLDQKKKIENLLKLRESVKNIFNKPKPQEEKQKSSKKSKKKKSKKKKLQNHDINNDQSHQGSKNKSVFSTSTNRFEQSQNGFNQTEKQQNKSQQNFNFFNQNKTKKIQRESQISEIEQNDDSYSINDEELPVDVKDLLEKCPPTQYLYERIAIILQNQNEIDTSQMTGVDLLLLSYHFMTEAALKIQSKWKTFKIKRNKKLKVKNLNNLKLFSKQLLIQKKQKEDIKNKEEQQQIKQKQLPTEEDLVVIQQEFTPIKQQQKKQQNYGQVQIQQQPFDSSIIENKSLFMEVQQGIEKIQSLIGEEKANLPKNFSKEMEKTILEIINNQIKKYKSERKISQHSECQLRLSQEANSEKYFNDARKQLQKTLDSSESKIMLQSKDFMTDINRSSLVALQSQLMKKENDILNIREETIQLRYQAEIKKAAENEEKKIQLEKWLQKEMEDLFQTRAAIESSIKREASAMKKIERDLLIAQSFDENNSKLQTLKQRVDEQFSSIKQQKSNTLDSKFIINQQIDQKNELDNLAETHSEDYEQDEENLQQKQLFLQNEQLNEEDQINKENIITNEILYDLIDELTEEILFNQDEYAQCIQSLVKSSIVPQIPTSIIDIRYYIHQFFSFILPQYLQKILFKLNTPYGFNAFNKLQFIHGYDNDYGSEEFITFVLDESYFLQFEQFRLQQLKQQLGEDDDGQNEVSVLQEIEHIHNKAIFDACNEALNQFRIYYKNSGEPYPWETKEQSRQINEENLSDLLQQMEFKIVEWASTLSGFIPIEYGIRISNEKQLILDEKHQQMIIQQMQYQESPELYNPEYSTFFDPIAQIREQRLNKMLIQDMQNNEFRWNLHSDDKTECLMEIGDQVFEDLIEQLLIEVNQNFANI